MVALVVMRPFYFQYKMSFINWIKMNHSMENRIYVFKTSVKYKKQIRAISKQFETIDIIKKWNFDLDDCDKILRIESPENVTPIVYLVLHSLDICCTELE